MQLSNLPAYWQHTPWRFCFWSELVTSQCSHEQLGEELKNSGLAVIWHSDATNWGTWFICMEQEYILIVSAADWFISSLLRQPTNQFLELTLKTSFSNLHNLKNTCVHFKSQSNRKKTRLVHLSLIPRHFSEIVNVSSWTSIYLRWNWESIFFLNSAAPQLIL